MGGLPLDCTPRLLGCAKIPGGVGIDFTSLCLPACSSLCAYDNNSASAYR